MEEYEKRTTGRQKPNPKEPWEIFVSQGCKMRNVIPYCLKMLTVNSRIVLSGMGAQINKTISIAEVIKRKHKNICQETEISYTELEDQWEPKDKTKGLDTLSVKRQVPTIQITLSFNSEEKAGQDGFDTGTLVQLKKDLKADLRRTFDEKNGQF